MVTMTRDEQQITRAARTIAGCIFDEFEGTLESRIEQAIEFENLGTDGDLSETDRDRLRLLLDAATGITSDLMDSETGEVIREAKVEEACASAEAGPEGHIAVDWRKDGGWNGEDFRRCFVAL